MEVVFIAEEQKSLPFSKTFNPGIEGPVAFFLSASMSSTAANTTAGINFYLDSTDNLLGSLRVYCDVANAHRTAEPMIVSANLTFGEHTLIVQAMNDATVVDGDDSLFVEMLF